MSDSIQVLQETTTWTDNTPNHRYVVKGDRMLAYSRAGTEEWCIFIKPKSFAKKGRTFTKVGGEILQGITLFFENMEITNARTG